MPRHNEVYIHSEVLRARSDVACVIHSHPMHAVAFSSLGKPLVAVGNSSVHFTDGRLPFFPRPPISSSVRSAAGRWRAALARTRR